MIRAVVAPANQRLGTSCADWACVIDAVNANKAAGAAALSSVARTLASPELDEWMYDTPSGGKEFSMTCSQFAAHAWKVGLGAAFPAWAAIQANEQTPKDNYQLGHFDATPGGGARINAATCAGGLREGDAGGVGSYCQLMGTYALPLNGYNTVPLYAGMNNVCVSQLPPHWQGYYRCPGEAAGDLSCC